LNSDKIDKEGVLNKTPSFCFKRAVNYSLAVERTGERVAFLQKSSAKNLSDESFFDCFVRCRSLVG